MTKLFIGIDLGGTNIKIGAFDSDLKFIEKISAPTEDSMGPDDVVRRICENVEALIKNANSSLDDIVAMGVGSPGPVDIEQGIIVAAPNLPKFRNTPLKQMIMDRLHKPVIFENDANAACFGEFTLGAAKDVTDMVFFTLGTGIGGGIVSHGKLIHGHNNAAAELGHIIIHPGGRLCGCGQKGCVEAYASAPSTVARAIEALETASKSTLSEIKNITCKDIYDHAKAGDRLALEITEGTADALGLLCVNMLHTTEPEKIIFAGGIIAAGDFLLNQIQAAFEKHIWPMKKETLEICFATLGEDAGIIGAAAIAKQLK